jgi:hypothetical protein
MIEKAANINIDLITKWIQDEKCILILGPDIVFDFQKSLLNKLSEHLIKNGIECKFDSFDELFSSTTDFDPFFFAELSAFFDNLSPSAIYQKIAEIPFNLIISLSPDLLLKQLFDKSNFDYSFDFYNKILNPKQIENPKKEKPLIYNILGNYKEFDSLVLCFHDVFNYLAAILGNNQLNGDLKYKINSAQSILFLGFKYDKWYFKLILQLLNLGEKSIKQASLKEIEHTGLEINKQNMVVDFYKNEFKIRFINQEGVEIIDSLHNYFMQNNNLRKQKKETSAAQNVTNIINVNDSTDVTILQNITDSNLNLNQKK